MPIKKNVRILSLFTNKPILYVLNIDENDKTVLRFGAGISDNPDEEVIPNPDSVGSSLPGTPTYLDTSFDLFPS